MYKLGILRFEIEAWKVVWFGIYGYCFIISQEVGKSLERPTSGKNIRYYFIYSKNSNFIKIQTFYEDQIYSRVVNQ